MEQGDFGSQYEAGVSKHFGISAVSCLLRKADILPGPPQVRSALQKRTLGASGRQVRFGPSLCENS
jgi:hypothetical protein